MGTIITRKTKCPKCQGNMTMDIDNSGWGDGYYRCRCGQMAAQSQTNNDWE